jgi:hypothetical protein
MGDLAAKSGLFQGLRRDFASLIVATYGIGHEAGVG